MNVTQLLDLLDGVKKSGVGWAARCPAHEDHSPSLSVSEGHDGRVLLHCHAGCAVDSICAGLGIKPLDLFPPQPGRNDKPRIVETYDYVDKSGKLLFQKVRLQSKIFQQRRPDGNGGWIYDLKDTRRVLFRLPEVLAAIKAGETIYLVEGEKDAKALVNRGFCSTCNSEGAGKWKQEYSETLRGANVVVIADKDEPGRDHAKLVRDQLDGIAASVRCFELPDIGERKVNDASDFFDAGGTVEEFRRITESRSDFEFQLEIERLAAMPPTTYEIRRNEEAKRLGVRTSALDKFVERERGDDDTKPESGTIVPEIQPWEHPVDGAETLKAIADRIKLYVSLPDPAMDTVTLWVAHTHCHEAFTHSPRLNLYSPEKGCGKSTLIDVIQAFVWRPLAAENMTPATLFRISEKFSPTLLLDESDTWFGKSDEIRGLLDSGFRRGKHVFRCNPDNLEQIQTFNVFCPTLIAGLHRLPGTLADRSIQIVMKRSKAGESLAHWDEREGKSEEERRLARKLRKWSLDHFTEIQDIEPTLPESAFNRIADVWRPLFAIAQIAGGDWPTKATKAYEFIMEVAREDENSIGVLLLTDIRLIFEKRQVERIWTSVLIEELCKFAERPWSDYNRRSRESKITYRQIAKRLNGFDISSSDIRIGQDVRKGYVAEQFQDAWERYLPATPDSKRYNATTVGNQQVKPDSQTQHDTQCSGSEIGVTYCNDNVCSVVADKIGDSARSIACTGEFDL